MSEEERSKSKNVGSLMRLAPFMAPYRGLIFAALIALVVTAIYMGYQSQRALNAAATQKEILLEAVAADVVLE